MLIFLNFLSLKFHEESHTVFVEQRMFTSSWKIVTHLFYRVAIPCYSASSWVHYLSSPGLLFPYWESLQRLAWCFWGRAEENERRGPASYNLIPGGCYSTRTQWCRGIDLCAFYWERKRGLPLACNDGMISGPKPLLVTTDWNRLNTNGGFGIAYALK